MRKSVLVVEDDKDIGLVMMEALEVLGYEASLAHNGQEALDILARIPRPGVILLDLMMPVLDGWQFREQQIKVPKYEDIPVVVVTADGHAKTKAEKMGVPEGLCKPVDLEELSRVVETYCGK